MRGFWTDRRIGGHPRYVHCDSDELMQLPPSLRKCVCFLRVVAGGEDWVGTGFFVATPCGGEDAVYLVTCKHCLYPTEAKGPTTEVWIRVNLVGGGSEEIETDLKEWVDHPTSDVTMLAGAPLRSKFDYLYMPVRKSATAEFCLQHHIYPGEDVVVTGQLIYHPGDTEIMPIIRVGNLSAIPREPVWLEGGPEPVVLIETRSLGGLSGSPAFIHLDDWRRDSEGNLGVLGDTIPLEGQGAGANYLLGLVHGFYPTTGNDPDGVGGSAKGLNTGISVVIPVERIIDLIDHPKHRKQRESIIAEQEAKPRPTPASSRAPDSIDKTAELLGKLLAFPKAEIDGQS